VDDEERRRANAERQRRFRERLKHDPVALAAFMALQRKRQKAAYLAHRDERLIKRRAFVDTHRQEIYARNRDYFNRNREKIRAQQHAAYIRDLEANRAKDRERGRKRYAANPQAHHDYMKKWRASNPERARAYVRLSGHRRRAAAGGEFIRVEDWEALLRKHDRRCAYCGVHAASIEADHRTPLSRGGKNTIANILPACRRCNRRKRTKTEAEFRAWLSAQPKDSPLE
jgi:5-methylcytosine-specific restriction endonuclease McrA